jgi:GTPase
MVPIIAIVGRPNVGKSTLFNRLTRSRDALVANEPGLTRDRIYGKGKVGGREYILIDTGGLFEESSDISDLVARQADFAVQEADRILFLVDGRAGLTSRDEMLANWLRSQGKTVQVGVNKLEQPNPETAIAEFYALGLGEPLPLSSAHGLGVEALIESVLETITDPSTPTTEEDTHSGPRVAVIGRPNVGKSTLVNRILGEERVLVYDAPGTTRDSIEIPFVRHQTPYMLIDTAGVRRRSRIAGTIEKFSVLKTFQTLERANVAIILLDAVESITDQDMALMGLVHERGCGLIIAVNKWDGLSLDQRQRVRDGLDRRLQFVDYAPIHYISALHGTGVGNLFASIDKTYASAFCEVTTSRLCDMLADAINVNPPPMVQGRRIKLRYAHLGGHNPPRILLHGNQTEAIPGSYSRYLENYFRQALKLVGTPVKIEFRQGENPYQHKQNVLTPRQQAKRKRLRQHIGKKRR